MIALAVFIIIVIGLWTLVRAIFSRDPAPVTTSQTASKEKFADRVTKVRFTADGAIVNLENRRSIRITINQTERKIEILKGYNEEIIREQSFGNDTAAFTKFLTALDGYGYTLENPKVSKDERGVCPLGIRYIYEATYESGDPLRSWSSSCSGGNRIHGKVPGIQQLFRNQIPNYNKIVSDVNLTHP